MSPKDIAARDETLPRSRSGTIDCMDAELTVKKLESDPPKNIKISRAGAMDVLRENAAMNAIVNARATKRTGPL